MENLCEIPMRSMILLIVLGLLNLGGVDGGLCCSDGWISYQESCYLFVDVDKQSWTSAASHCESVSSSYLVTIESKQELTFLRNFASRLFKDGTHESRPNFWVGATDSPHEGQWHWYTNQTHVVSSALWHHGQPDAASSHEDCAILYGNYQFDMGDYTCSHHDHFICEKNLTETFSSYEITHE